MATTIPNLENMTISQKLRICLCGKPSEGGLMWDRKGLSRQAIAKWFADIGQDNTPWFRSALRRAIKNGMASGDIIPGSSIARFKLDREKAQAEASAKKKAKAAKKTPKKAAKKSPKKKRKAAKKSAPKKKKRAAKKGAKGKKKGGKKKGKKKGTKK
eukprot:21523_1